MLRSSTFHSSSEIRGARLLLYQKQLGTRRFEGALAVVYLAPDANLRSMSGDLPQWVKCTPRRNEATVLGMRQVRSERHNITAIRRTASYLRLSIWRSKRQPSADKPHLVRCMKFTPKEARRVLRMACFVPMAAPAPNMFQKTLLAIMFDTSMNASEISIVKKAIVPNKICT
jgi:hypothetical protein